MPDVLQSVRRLTTLARLGNVSIEATRLDAPPTPAMVEAVAALRLSMRDHGIGALDIATTVTDTEFLRVAGLLANPASSMPGGIVEAAAAHSIWNVRLREVGAATAPSAPALSSTAGGAAVSAGNTAVRDVVAAPVVVQPDGSAETVRQAVRSGDGAAVCRALTAIADPTRFESAATAVSLQLTTEWLVDDPKAYADVQAVLERAGTRGARAVFEQLVAATDRRERRILYDTAAGLTATVDVARQYLGDPVWYVVRNAAGLLGESRSAEAIPDLARLLRHADERVRVAAVVALGQIGGPLAIARLESVLLDPSPEVRNRALALVFASPDEDIPEGGLASPLEENASVEFQLEIIAALAHVRTPRARQRLEAHCLDTGRALEHDQVRLAAMNALAAGHRPEADATLRQLRDDPDSQIRDRAGALLQA